MPANAAGADVPLLSPLPSPCRLTAVDVFRHSCRWLPLIKAIARTTPAQVQPVLTVPAAFVAQMTCRWVIAVSVPRGFLAVHLYVPDLEARGFCRSRVPVGWSSSPPEPRAW